MCEHVGATHRVLHHPPVAEAFKHLHSGARSFGCAAAYLVAPYVVILGSKHGEAVPDVVGTEDADRISGSAT